MKRGVFCISIDTELLWGRKHLDYKPFIPRVGRERQAIKELLRLFGKYKIPVTWAIVGKLLEKPGKRVRYRELWYGPDILDDINSQKIHEVASHSYSHAFFGEISKTDAQRELESWQDVAKKNNIGASSFIFPKNSIGHLGLLKKYGFNAYRSPDTHAIEMLLPTFPPVHRPRKIDALVDIPGSLYYVSARSARKFIPNAVRVIKSKLGIDGAIKNRGVFHLWFHPLDFVDDKKMLEGFEKVLIYAAQKRGEGILEIKTMKDIAREVLA